MSPARRDRRGDPRMAPLAALLALVVQIALLAACSSPQPDGASDRGESPHTSSSRAGASELPAAAPAGEGPRALPPARVDLDLEAFARPADEACADNATVVEVDAGDSIGAALDEAEPGTTVLVAPGTYVENADASDALRWETDNVCLRADDGEVVIEAASGQGYGLVFTGDDTVVEGFTMRGFRTGVILGGRGGETQRRATLESVRVVDPVGDLREGILALGDGGPDGPVAHDGVLLLDVAVQGMDQGISCNFGPCDHWWVERTRVVGRNAVEGSGADNIAVESGRQVVLVDVAVSGAAADGIDLKAGDVVVYGARVTDVARNAVKLWHGGEVIEVVVDGSGADAALVGDGEGTYLYLNCLVAHHDPEGSGYVGGWSYDRRAPVEVEIVNSIFDDNSVGGFFVPAGAHLSVRNTIFSAAPEDKLFDVGDETYLIGDLTGFEDAGFGSGNLIADPMFVDPDAGNFATLPGSPARAAGEVVHGLGHDIQGNPRPVDARPDIGPLQSGA